MDRSFSLPMLYSFSFISIVLIYILSRRRISGRSLPPGPPGLPLVGNIFNAPSSFEWIKYAQWAKEFDSEIIFLQVLGTGMLVLSGREDAEELLVKRSAKYSDRPSIPMMDMIGNSEVIVPVMPYCDHWKDCRKLFHREVESKTILHRPHEIAATRRLLKHLCDSEARSVSSGIWKHWSSDVVLSMAYGIQVLPQNDPFVKIANEAASSFTMASQPGSFFVNVLPVLKHVPAWLPGAGFQQKAAEWRRAVYALVETPFDTVRDKLARGDHIHSSIASRVLPTLDVTNPEEFTKDSTTLRDVLANIFSAGPDLAVALETFLLAMVMNPSVVKEAQDAIDKVIGTTNLPSFEDLSNHRIPYLDALVNEVLRWNPIAPLAMAHATTADDVYKGFYIPKGTIVMANVWVMLRDEKVYGADAHLFNPKRFLDREGNIDTHVPAPDAAFGFGRRRCAGRYMALEALSFVIVSVLWCFNILKATNEKGEVVEPSGRYVSGAVCRPEPFECVFRLRSSRMRQLIMESLDE